MHNYAAVVCVGQDLLLLSLRCQVLATRFATVCPATPQTLARVLADRHFDLLLLCHSLSGAESGAAIRLFRRQTDDPVVVALCTNLEDTAPPDVDATVSTLGGPLALFHAIEGVMHNGAPRFGRPARIPPASSEKPFSCGI